MLLLVCLIVTVYQLYKIYTRLAVIDHFTQWHSKTDTVIVVAQYNHDLKWLENAPYPVVACSKFGSRPSAITPDDRCTIVVNKGREHASYIKFILEYYDALPLHIAFIHGHERALHQHMDILEAIRCAKKSRFGYISLDNHVGNDEWGEDDEGYKLLLMWWDSYFRPYLKADIPKNVSGTISSQFIVGRERILRHPRYVYRKWLDLLITSRDEYHTTRAFQVLWPIIFGKATDDADTSAKFDCTINHVSTYDGYQRHLESEFDNVYIVVTTMRKYADALNSFVSTMPTGKTNYIVVYQDEPADSWVKHQDGHYEVHLTSNIYEYAAWTGVHMLQQAKAVRDDAWFLLLHDTCKLMSNFKTVLATTIARIPTHVDIYWADNQGRSNFCLARRSGISYGGVVYGKIQTLTKGRAIGMEWNTDPISPKQFPVDQMYDLRGTQTRGKKSVYSDIERQVLYYPSLDIEKYFRHINEDETHPECP